jgi:hypothetical protein
VAILPGLLRLGLSADETRQQSGIAIGWERYGELFEYDAENGRLILEFGAAREDATAWAGPPAWVLLGIRPRAHGCCKGRYSWVIPGV